MLTVGELFAGIGGIGLGLERTGHFEVKWQVERDEYATKVLAKHWPDVFRHDDVCTFPPDDGKNYYVDVITGGFPCQDISVAGKGEGLEGARSGLFYEIVRIAQRLKPRYLLLENVSAILVRGMDTVLRELAEIGFNAEWHCIPAASVGASHRRDRVFIIAYSQHNGSHGVGENEQERQREEVGRGEQSRRNGSNGNMARFRIQQKEKRQKDVYTDPKSIRRERLSQKQIPRKSDIQKQLERVRKQTGRSQWAVESDVGRVANGVPGRVDRLRCLGNAVVPQVAQFVGEMILKIDQELNQ